MPAIPESGGRAIIRRRESSLKGERYGDEAGQDVEAGNRDRREAVYGRDLARRPEADAKGFSERTGADVAVDCQRRVGDAAAAGRFGRRDGRVSLGPNLVMLRGHFPKWPLVTFPLWAARRRDAPARSPIVPRAGRTLPSTPRR